VVTPEDAIQAVGLAEMLQAGGAAQRAAPTYHVHEEESQNYA
jgi:hypothetical protein